VTKQQNLFAEIGGETSDIVLKDLGDEAVFDAIFNFTIKNTSERTINIPFIYAEIYNLRDIDANLKARGIYVVQSPHEAVTTINQEAIPLGQGTREGEGWRLEQRMLYKAESVASADFTEELKAAANLRDIRAEELPTFIGGGTDDNLPPGDSTFPSLEAFVRAKKGSAIGVYLYYKMYSDNDSSWRYVWSTMPLTDEKVNSEGNERVQQGKDQKSNTNVP
jgi:hypothetical protein